MWLQVWKLMKDGKNTFNLPFTDLPFTIGRQTFQNKTYTNNNQKRQRQVMLMANNNQTSIKL